MYGSFDKIIERRIYSDREKELNLNLGYTYRYNRGSNKSKNKNKPSKQKMANTINYKINIFNSYLLRKKNLKILPGMFSYKRKISKKNSNDNIKNLNKSYNSLDKHNINEIPNKKSKNNINYVNFVNNNNNNKNNIILNNIKSLVDNTESSSIISLSNNDCNSIQPSFFSSVNLNKFKLLNDANIKNRSMDMGNIFDNTHYNFDFLKYNNIIINNIQQPKMRSRSNEIMHINNKKNKSKKKHKNSFGYEAKKNANNENSMNDNNISKELKLKETNYFEGKTKAENESRRMIIDYLKVLQSNDPNDNKNKINDVLKSNNISSKVLNQQMILNSYNYSYSLPTNLSKVEEPKKKTNLKNVKKFLNNMNDVSNDKINMIKFLSIPRIMELNFMEQNYKFIFMLMPSSLSYIKGIESYLFQWNDINSSKAVGGFDLLKVNSCYINYKNNKNVFIETFDGINHRQYELLTKSSDIASLYVKSINYLSRLEKSKVYKRKFL